VVKGIPLKQTEPDLLKNSIADICGRPADDNQYALGTFIAYALIHPNNIYIAVIHMSILRLMRNNCHYKPYIGKYLK